MATSCLHIGANPSCFTTISEGEKISRLPRPSMLLCCVGSAAKQNRSSLVKNEEMATLMSRREVLGAVTFTAALSDFLLSDRQVAAGAGLPQEVPLLLCDEACAKELENVPMVTTESGLQYKDIIVGKGPNPPVGYQVAANYVAMVPSGKVFDSSLEKGRPYIFRVGAGQVIKGLDEGLLSMKPGGKRRLYIPGPLAFPKGLGAAAGRPRVPPSSPVVFDVSLEYIPGLDEEEE